MKRELFTAVAFALALPAHAQAPQSRVEHRLVIDGHDILAEARAAKGQAEAWRLWGDDLRASLGTMFGESFAAAKPVKGAPYSAEVSTQTTQTLADGNVIAKKTSGRIYRDGEGRTRQETVVDGKATSIQLRDPVKGTAVMLLPGSNKAVRLPKLSLETKNVERKVLRLGDREIQVENGKVSVDGKPLRGKVEITAGGKTVRVEDGHITIDGKPFATGADEGKVAVKLVEVEDSGDGTRREEVRVHVVRGPGGAQAGLHLPAMPPLGPLGGRLDGALLHARGTTTALGEKEIEGVRVEGKSTVRTIAAGEIGNRNPILVTSESWYSPELQVTVFSRQADPRFGETTYRLSNIRREEPDASLFAVPPGYTESGKGARRERHPPG